MKQQIDWGKVLLLLIVLIGGGYVAKDKLGIKFPLLTSDTSKVPIPDPDPECRAAVQPLVAVKSTNPRAAAVLSDFLASYAWVIEHNDQRNTYNSSSLMKNIESGLESLFALQAEVGDIDIGDPLNKSLQEIWGDETRVLTKADAARGIYACAWGLQI